MGTPVSEFDRDYLVRLPLPLAQLYKRAFNAAEARARHNNTFFLFEATIKLAASVLVAGYARSLEAGEPRNSALDEPLKNLQRPSLGQWVGILRELARHFGRRADAASHPLGHFAAQLEEPRRELAGMLNLYRRIKNGPDGKPAGDESCSLLALFDALVKYRNTVMGHGADRCDAFYEQEMGPLLLPAAADVLAEGVLDFLGPTGSRLVYLGEVRKLESDRFEVGVRELLGAGAMRVESLSLTAEQAQKVSPNRLAVLWRGQPVPLRLDPLLVFREAELNEDVRFLNADRDGKHVEYLSYTSGKTERDPTTVADLGRLLELVTGHAPLTQPEEIVADTARLPQDFEILAEIGRGGMGVVYLARQISLGRLVALKLLPAELSGDEAALARFSREIRALGQCDDPHIVKVLTSGKFPDGQRYYAMEYVPGADLDVVWHELSGYDREASASSLGSTTWSRAVLTACRRQRSETVDRAKGSSSGGVVDAARVGADAGSVHHGSLKAGLQQDATTHSPEAAKLLEHLAPLPELPVAEQDPGGYARRVAMLMRDAARALQTVHDQGIVHRDVKPANLMLSPDGTRVVLMDFGLAKGDTRTLQASRIGGLLGTLRYAAPEQLAAANFKVGPKADVRGLGVSMFELLTRRRLFDDAADEKQLASLVLNRDVPRLRSIDPALDRDLEALVARATERDQDHRLTARQFADYLQLYLDAKPLPIRLPGMAETLRRWVREHRAQAATLAAAAAALLLVGTVTFVLIARSRDRAVKAEADAVAAKNDVVAKNTQLEGSLNREQGLNIALTDEKAQLLFEQGCSEYDDGKEQIGCVDLFRAWKLLSTSNPLKATCERIAVDRTTRAGGLVALLLKQAKSPVAVFSPDGARVVTGGEDNTARMWSAVTGQPLGEPMRHDGAVNAVAFSADGKRIVTGSDDKTARLWDAATSKPLGEAMRHGGPVWEVVFSPDGTRLLTRCADIKTIRLWDVATCKPLGEPIRTENSLDAVTFSPDGTRVLTASGDYDKKRGEARLWDAATGKPLGQPMRHDNVVRAVAFSPDGTRVVTASFDNTARLWDGATGKPLGEVMRHEDSVGAVAFSPDGTRVLTGSFDHTAQLWDAITGKHVGQPMHHDGGVPAVAFSPDGTRVVTRSDDGTAHLWDAATGKPLGEPMLHENNVTAVAFSPDGTRVVTGSLDYTARLWDAATGKPLRRPMILDSEVQDVAFSPGGTRVLTRSRDGTAALWDAGAGNLQGTPIRPVLRDLRMNIDYVAFSPDGARLVTRLFIYGVQLWDARTGKLIVAVRDPVGVTSVVALSPDGTRVLTGTRNTLGLGGAARLWDSTTGKPLGEPMPHESSINAVAFSPDGRRVVTGSDDKTARLWDASTGKPLCVPMRHGTKVTAVAFSPDGTRVATGSNYRGDVGGEARIWDVATGKPFGEPMRVSLSIDAVAFSADGTRLVTASYVEAQLWNVATCKALGNVMKHQQQVTAVAFSPDGTRVLTASDDKTARLWDAATGKPLGASMRHAGKVITATFAHSGTHVLTASEDGTARFWDGATGKPLGTPIQHGKSLRAAALSADGTHVATAGEDHTARLWDVTSAPLPKDIEAWFQVRLGVAVDDRGNAIPLNPDEDQQSWQRLAADPTWQDSFRRFQARRILLERYQLATNSTSARNWFAADFHWSWLCLQEPKHSDWWLKLGYSAAEQGHWVEANRAYAAASQLDSSNEYWAGHAALAAGDRAAFQQDAARLLATAKKSADVADWQRAVWLAAIVDEKSDYWPKLVALAKKCVAKSEKNWSCREVLGEALYRSGDYAAALEELNKAVELNPVTETVPDSSNGSKSTTPAVADMSDPDATRASGSAAVDRFLGQEFGIDPAFAFAAPTRKKKLGYYDTRAFLVLVHYHLGHAEEVMLQRELLTVFAANHPPASWLAAERRKLLDAEILRVCGPPLELTGK